MINLADVQPAKLSVQVLPFDVGLKQVDDGRNTTFISEALNVLVGMSIAFLQDLDKLFIHSLHRREHASTDAVKSLRRILFRFDLSLVKALVVLLLMKIKLIKLDNSTGLLHYIPRHALP